MLRKQWKKAGSYKNRAKKLQSKVRSMRSELDFLRKQAQQNQSKGPKKQDDGQCQQMNEDMTREV
jgi:hypothetical protein